MRKTLVHESCCELVLFAFIAQDKLQVNDFVRLLETGIVPCSIERRIQKLAMEIRNEMLQKEKQLVRFGIRSREDGILTDDFVKWYTWWNNWYITLPMEILVVVKEKMTITGEMSTDDILKYRPPGRWQTMIVEN